jgi:hypothetical protein
MENTRDSIVGFNLQQIQSVKKTLVRYNGVGNNNFSCILADLLKGDTYYRLIGVFEIAVMHRG